MEKQGIFSMRIVYSNLPHHTNLIDIVFKSSFPAEIGSICAGRIAKVPQPHRPSTRQGSLPPAAFPLLLYNAQRTFKESAQGHSDTSQTPAHLHAISLSGVNPAEGFGAR